MASVFVVSAMEELLPGAEAPRAFVAYCQSLYQSSKQAVPLPRTYELARIHFCVYVAILRFRDRYGWADPLSHKIPVPKNRVAGYIRLFASLVDGMSEGMMESSAQAPQTPTHTRVVDALETPITPSTSSRGGRGSGRVNRTPHTTAKLVATPSSSVKRSLTNKLMAESSLSGTTEIPQAFLTPPGTPQKGFPAGGSLGDSKVSLSATPPATPQRRRRPLTSHELVTFANHFYIPAHLTGKILATYHRYRTNVRSPWGLLVGLVGVVYRRVNAAQLAATLGLWARVIRALHRWQAGGLTPTEVDSWVTKVEGLYGEVKWIREAEYEPNQIGSNSVDRNAAHTVATASFSSLGQFASHGDYLGSRATAAWETWAASMKQYA